MRLLSLSLLWIALPPCIAGQERLLRVCADPNNMPFSNEQGQGFENKIAELLAAGLDAKLEYIWWSERKSFLKNSLNEHRCDLIGGVPTSLDSVTVTRPYYKSSYVFVSRDDRHLHLLSLADPRLSQLRIGIQVVGDDYAPPAFALARRGITQNITGFSLFGEYGEHDPPRRIIDAVDRGDIDVAIVWGPFAGYFTKTAASRLDITPVTPTLFLGVPFTYNISMGVRKGNYALKAKLDEFVQSEWAAIQQILRDYGVPEVQ